MKNKFIPILIVSLIFIGFSNSCNASIISQKFANGLTLSAEYSTGEQNKAVVLIVHGFLQTRNYLTVQSLMLAVRDEGYSVLAPNLSLAISNRKQSLACEAIHRHNMQQDIEEIDYWVKWLENKGHKKIILVGHSFGSLQILLYANKKKRASIKTIIAASLVDIEKAKNNTISKSHLVKARQLIEKNSNSLFEYSLSYCKKYISPAKDFLSYAKWTRAKIISALKQSIIPISVILGSKDIRVNGDWISQLKQSNINLIIIEGANHFFDSSHEFDLNDQVLTLLAVN